MQILNVTGGLSGDCFLFKTDSSSVLVDCASPVDANKLVENLKFVLGDEPLDYIFLTHSHYDHVGGTPYIKEAFPNVKVVASAYAKKILEKPSALKAIRDISFTDDFSPEYDNDLLKVDIAIDDNEIFYAGDIKIQAFEALGHTKCSLVFLINDNIFISNESIGPMNKEGLVCCSPLVGFDLSLCAIEKFSNMKYDFLIAPHHGIITDIQDYFDRCREITIETRDFLIDLIEKGLTFEEIFKCYENKYYNEEVSNQMPKKAFIANGIAIIATLMKNYQ